MTVKRIITIAAALSLAVSCLTQIEDSLEVDWTSDTIAASGGTLVLSVNSTGEWDYVAENALWCEITRMDDVLIIKAGENKVRNHEDVLFYEESAGANAGGKTVRRSVLGGVAV